MKNRQISLIALAAVLGLAACAPADDDGAGQGAMRGDAMDIATGSGDSGPAVFERFVYSGSDPEFDVEVGEGQYLNPILAGFYPDPGNTQVGGDYYIVNSTFAYYPGIPVFHSTDLVNWTQIGNVIDRPDMLDFSGLRLSRGVFAPTIEEHEGTFYVANTCVDCGGNFIVTAADPAGPWSDPVWTRDVGGIDPSLFFDDDGKVWLMNNDAPEGEPRYQGHRAIWIREVDPETFESLSEPVVIIDGGVRPEENPIWIEGPHIYKVDGMYYLSAAEGGTAVGHSQVVLRSDTVEGPYEPYEGNPILTQRTLPWDRENPITSVGHADYVTDDDGKWWATFLGVRPYEGDFYNTGRETFMLPVEWRDGWPVILDEGTEVPWLVERPALPLSEPPAIPTRGNFEIVEEFDGPLEDYWLFVRVPQEEWWSVGGGTLTITPRNERLGDRAQPSVVTRRQQHKNAVAMTEMRFMPDGADEEAGLLVMQNDWFYYAMGLTLTDDGETVMRVRKKAGDDTGPRGEIVAEMPVEIEAGDSLSLRIEASGDLYDFSFMPEGGEWQTLLADADGKILSTATATGFVGATFGMYAEGGE